MNPVIRLRQGVAVIPCESGVQLRWGDEAVHVLESSDRETLTRLLSMIDGQNTEASFIERALEPWRGLAKQLLVELKSANLLVYGAPPPNETIGCLEKYGVSGESFEQAILSTKVNLWGPASVCAKAKSMLLQHSVECGNYQEISADLFDCTLMVVVQKAPDLSAMLSMNQELIAKQIAALWVDLSHGPTPQLALFMFLAKALVINVCAQDCVKIPLRLKNFLPLRIICFRRNVLCPRSRCYPLGLIGQPVLRSLRWLPLSPKLDLCVRLTAL